MKKPKALTQVISPGYLRVSWSFFCNGDLFFLLYKFREKQQFYDPTFQKPFDQFQRKFFLQL
jgi:hypothetical protein